MVQLLLKRHLRLFQKNADGTVSKDEPLINRGGRVTNQLEYLKKLMRILWRHHYAWPFHKPVDPVALNLPVRGPCGSRMWLGLCYACIVMCVHLNMIMFVTHSEWIIQIAVSHVYGNGSLLY